ncbi:hypothetical protein HHI36_004471 [Cryptolaemus montrouzieri]|uniref:Uncharacterized protein n=1 Tax=Cryptolaemus montrouzieri TaxID=559131 RepID=A0ABD2NRS1_9CUCU
MQFDGVTNCSDKTVDLIFCNKFRVSSSVQCDSPLVREHEYHPSIEFFFNLNYKYLETRKNTEVFRFHKSDYITINRRISDVPWSEILSNGDKNADLNTYVILNNIIEDHVPKKSLRKNFRVTSPETL